MIGFRDTYFNLCEQIKIFFKRLMEKLRMRKPIYTRMMNNTSDYSFIDCIQEFGVNKNKIPP